MEPKYGDLRPEQDEEIKAWCQSWRTCWTVQVLINIERSALRNRDLLDTCPGNVNSDRGYLSVIELNSTCFMEWLKIFRLSFTSRWADGVRHPDGVSCFSAKPWLGLGARSPVTCGVFSVMQVKFEHMMMAAGHWSAAGQHCAVTSSILLLSLLPSMLTY